MSLNLIVVAALTIAAVVAQLAPAQHTALMSVYDAIGTVNMMCTRVA